MPQTSIKLGLSDPGMTPLHRVGLAGLYMTLSRLNIEDFSDVGGWHLNPHHIELYWSKTPKQLIGKIAEKSFSIKEGLIDFYAHHDISMGDLEKILLNKIIMETFLQHGNTRKISKTEELRSIALDDKIVIQKIKPLLEYPHQKIDKLKIFDSKGNFKKSADISGWLFPGGAVRHVAYTSETGLSANPAQFLSLLFSPVAALYFSIYHKNPDGKFDDRKVAAIILPDIKDLSSYSCAYKRYLKSPVHQLYADSLGDAGLIGLTTLNVFDPQGNVQQLDVDSCTVILMGTVGWSKQQKVRTGLMYLSNIDKYRLNLFNLALRTLENTPNIKDDSFFVRTSLCRGLIADNIASGRNWFDGFVNFMRSKKLAKHVSYYERKGLNKMVNNAAVWSFEADKLFVESLHKAIRNRYGALADRAKQRGESVQFDREFERLRTSLMRAKNAQTLRAELADIFARGRTNKTLQENWTELLPLFTGQDWQRARDLALLALVSYSGKGVKELDAKSELEGEEE